MSIDWSNPFAIADWSALSWPERFELVNPMFWRYRFIMIIPEVILVLPLLWEPQLLEQHGKL